MLSHERLFFLKFTSFKNVFLSILYGFKHLQNLLRAAFDRRIRLKVGRVLVLLLQIIFSTLVTLSHHFLRNIHQLFFLPDKEVAIGRRNQIRLFLDISLCLIIDKRLLFCILLNHHQIIVFSIRGLV